MKVKDLIQMLEEYPEDKPLDIIYFNESEPWKRVICDIHDLCSEWYSIPGNKYEEPFTRKCCVESVCLEIVGRNYKDR